MGKKKARKKKSAYELTTDEAMRRLFPAKVIRQAKKVAHEGDDAGENTAKKRKKNE